MPRLRTPPPALTLALALLLACLGPVLARGRHALGDAAGEDPPGIYVANLGGSEPKHLVEDAGAPAWSPDGASIAFADGDIWVMGADGSGKHRLTSGDEHDAAPSWSPDGAAIAFVRSPIYLGD